MKKCVIFISLILGFLFSVQAQSPLKYQGDLQLGYSYGINHYSYDKFNLHFINSIRLGKYVSTGLGIGLDFHYNYNLIAVDCGKMRDKSGVSFPIFWNIKGYLPLVSKFSLFVSGDIGWSKGINNNMKDLQGLLFTPGIGASFNFSSRNSLSFGIGYVLQKWEGKNFDKIITESIQFKLGFSF